MKIIVPQQNTNIQGTNRKTGNSSKGISEHTSNVSNHNQKYPVATSEKTVHKKEITKLNKDITTGLSHIKSKLSNILSDKASGPFQNDSIKELKSQLDRLTASVKSYQDKLDSSSYKHNSSKQKTITKLETKLSTITEKMSKAESNNKFNVSRGNQAHLDNKQKAFDLREGNKAPSKFEP
ncbi:hypothetical protein KDV38_01445 [Providencia rettgeri]